MILAVRVDQLGRVEQVAAVVALIAARVGIVADVTLALDVAVGQEALFEIAVEQFLLLFVEVAAFEQQQKDVLRDLVVVLGVGVREQVVADADLLLREQEALVIVLEDRARGDAPLVRLDRDRRAVTVRSRHHQDVIPLEAVIAREDVGGQVSARDVSDVEIAVGVGPSDGDVNVFGHGFLLKWLVLSF